MSKKEYCIKTQMIGIRKTNANTLYKTQLLRSFREVCVYLPSSPSF